MDGELKRGLSSRHMNMIAIGGAIGTGLFVALLAKGVTAPIASARTIDQLDALLAAPDLVLSSDEVCALDEVSAVFAHE
jgi:hypothetical protein